MHLFMWNFKFACNSWHNHVWPITHLSIVRIIEKQGNEALWSKAKKQEEFPPPKLFSPRTWSTISLKIHLHNAETWTWKSTFWHAKACSGAHSIHASNI